MANKPARLFRQSAVIPYLVSNGVTEVVLVTSSSSKYWVIPKGVIERSMSPEDSAAKEALEEAGVTGNVSGDVVTEYRYKKWGGTCHVKVYPLEVKEVLPSWDEMEDRERIFVEIPKAIKLARTELKRVLKIFHKMRSDQ